MNMSRVKYKNLEKFNEVLSTLKWCTHDIKGMSTYGDPNQSIKI